MSVAGDEESGLVVGDVDGDDGPVRRERGGDWGKGGVEGAGDVALADAGPIGAHGRVARGGVLGIDNHESRGGGGLGFEVGPDEIVRSSVLELGRDNFDELATERDS